MHRLYTPMKHLVGFAIIVAILAIFLTGCAVDMECHCGDRAMVICNGGINEKACMQFTTLKSAQAFMNTVMDRGDAGAPENIPAKEMTLEQYERLLAKGGLTNPVSGSLAVPVDPPES